MKRVAKDAGRGYHSELREHQAAETRGRILDAAARVMARGAASTSMPAVAREAGVSIPTVYRYFRTKAVLFTALYPHMVYRAPSIQLELPSSIDDFAVGLREHFTKLDSLGEAERAVLNSPAAAQMRRANMPSRIRRTRAVVDAIAPPDPRIDRDRLTRLLIILTGTAAFRTWRDYLGSSVDEAVADIEWAIHALINASTTEDG